MYTGTLVKNLKVGTNAQPVINACAGKKRSGHKEKYQGKQQQTVVTYNQNWWLTTHWNLLLSSTTTINSRLVRTEVGFFLKGK